MWFWLSLIPVLTGGGAWLIYTAKRECLRTWLAAVAACGLNLEKSSSLWLPLLRVEASAGPLKARIRERRDDTLIAVTIQGPPGFQGVRIHREAWPWAREIEIGDQEFDDKFCVEGPLRLVCALLDAGTRRLLAGIDKYARLEIAGGEIRAEMRGNQVAKMLPLLVDLGRRLAQPLDIARRMAANACDDPATGVRLQNLLLMVREFPGDPVTLEALRAAALLDSSPQVRLWAAQELGEEGRDTLLELAESSIGDTWSAQAVSALDRELPLGRLQALLTAALRRRQIQTAFACMEVLGRHGGPSAVDRLVEVMERESGDLAVAAAMALGMIGDAAAEPPLIAALQRDNAILQAAAANALARAGSIEAVLPLKEAAEGSGDSDLRRAARQAIAEIQSRLPGASPGQLSLAADEAGQLSIAPHEAGQLSLPPKLPER